VLQKWRNVGQSHRCWCGSQIAGHAPDEKLFRNVANRRDRCRMGAVFVVKKEIPVNAYTLNNITSKKSTDGSVTIQFGGCDGKIANCLPIMPGGTTW
jgi:hypothetical protein